ncbi:MAG: mobile mystery protein A [Bacteroides sp.]|nr:mobile mystery protein A [Bacteroides sp.]
MRTQRRLVVEQLDRRLALFSEAAKVPMPEKGWIHIIRTSLNMTLEQLGSKLSKTKQAVKRIESSEAAGSITLNLLEEAGNAMEMRLVYGFVPVTGSVDKLIDDKALALAERIVLRANHNMLLENQATSNEAVQMSIKELAAELKREMKRSIWD